MELATYYTRKLLHIQRLVPLNIHDHDIDIVVRRTIMRITSSVDQLYCGGGAQTAPFRCMRTGTPIWSTYTIIVKDNDHSTIITSVNNIDS